ncbi:MAG TPA: hypothetical protein VG347_11290 [Verrucomicrobiae bacterium]|nr:hypothetical protein [Verrucomicrobiae bacterium]
MVLSFITACHHKIPHVKLSPEAARQARLDWNLKTLVTAYLDAGNTDAKWDEAATNALAVFASSRSGTVIDDYWQNSIATNCEAAIKAGCDDPMIRYLHLRFPMVQATPKEYADGLCKVEADMQQSSYPPIRKFYLSVRALEQVYAGYSRNEVDRNLTRELADNMLENLSHVVIDKSTPAEEVYEACDNALGEMKGSKDWYERCYTEIEAPLFANWPDDAVPWLLKGQAEIDRSWLARGHGYANTVSPEQWKSFAEHNAAAEKALAKAWKLDPNDERIARQMISVVLAKSGSRDEMETWFARAMNLAPNDYAACDSKLNFIAPQWFGSNEEMLKFGRECMANKNWAGTVPLILVEVHRIIRASLADDADKDGYWKQPEVWADIQSACQRYFEINPTAVDTYYDYAWYAYYAEQWDKFNELVPKLGTVNYAYFGGEAEFNKMVQTAKDHIKPK